MTHAPVNLLLPMFADALEMLSLTRASFHPPPPRRRSASGARFTSASGN